MNEYISRDKVLNKFIEGDGHDDDRFTEGYNFAVQEHREEVENIPAADVQPVKHGRWENTNTPNQLRCSNCEIIHLISQYPHGDIKYCPNCGARMDGDSE